MFVYFINGIRVESQVDLPCNPNISPNVPVNTELIIRYGGLEPSSLSSVHWVAQRPWSRAYWTGDGLMVCALNDFKMHVASDGTIITLFYDSICARAKALAAACAINLGFAMSLLLRGYLPLHAASATVSNHLIGVMAESGTGKTTTLWKLLDKGSQFFADDMTTVAVLPEGPYAAPSVSQHAKLSREALHMRGWSEADFDETYHMSEEYWVPIAAEHRALTVERLDALFVLNPTPFLATTGKFIARRVEDAEAISLISNNMQGLWPVIHQINRLQYIKLCLALAQKIPIYVLQYNKSYDDLSGLIDLIQSLSAEVT